MAGFPLRCLPLLPLNDVFSYMHLGDLIRVHLCSKKTRDLLETIKKSVSLDSLSECQKHSLNVLETLYLLLLETYNNPRGSVGCFPENTVTTTITIASDDKIELKVDTGYLHANRDLFCPHLFFLLERNTHDRPLGIKKDNFDFDGITVPVWSNDKTIHTYWKDQSDGLTVLVNYFKKFFNAQTIKYIINESNNLMFSQNFRIVVNGMAQQTISSCEIHSDNMNNDNFKLILDNINPSHSFRQDSFLESRINNFQHNIGSKLECFKLEHANWLTFDNLITLDCKEICLFGSRLTNDNLKEYVKQWMTGKYSKLRFLTVELQEYASIEYILSELEQFSENSSFSRSQLDSEKYTIIRQSDIHILRIVQQDKIVATVSIPNGNSSKKLYFFTNK